ncbi:hypothetical protein JJV70_07060 [Streptomyces sp. JJ66]|uniref:hypothetical protein n=1 Tax=Streptomyces sp. JJ66 TaxID=2803843 RepID=UPI001C5797E7|nr:hypothetical protein [Streptomyces sp. JJ66]MBW1601872.1 hypothetical protein [Streptomyces sp. JJ66]
MGLLVTLTGCGSGEYEIPPEACGTKMDRGAIAAVLPPGEELEVSLREVGSEIRYDVCSFAVDGVIEFSVRRFWEGKAVEPRPLTERWQEAESSGGPLELGEAGAVSADGFIAVYSCPEKGRTGMLIVDGWLGSDVPEGESKQEELAEFARSYVPGAVRNAGCR